MEERERVSLCSIYCGARYLRVGEVPNGFVYVEPLGEKAGHFWVCVRCSSSRYRIDKTPKPSRTADCGPAISAFEIDVHILAETEHSRHVQYSPCVITIRVRALCKLGSAWNLTDCRRCCRCGHPTRRRRVDELVGERSVYHQSLCDRDSTIDRESVS